MEKVIRCLLALCLVSFAAIAGFDPSLPYYQVNDDCGNVYNFQSGLYYNSKSGVGTVNIPACPLPTTAINISGGAASVLGGAANELVYQTGPGTTSFATIGSGLSLSGGTLTAIGGGTGTVTSVGVSGGTTGLTTTGTPVTTSGTITIGGTLGVANGGTGVTSSTGTGAVVLSNSPTLVTPALGTPASGVATNLTGNATGLSIGGNAATATSVNGGSVTATTGSFSGAVTVQTPTVAANPTTKGYVDAAIGNKEGLVSYSATATEPVTDYGKLIYVSGSFTLTAPSSAGVAAGAMLEYNNQGTGIVTINGNGVNLVGLGYAAASTFALYPYTSLKLIYDGVNYQITAINGVNVGGTSSTAYGVGALSSNTGTNNAAVGAYALANNTSGSNNSVLGYFSSAYSTTGSNNAAVGANTLILNISGDNNSALGFEALYSSTVGYNSAVGAYALEATTTGIYNVGIGELAGYTSTPANANVSGSNNTWVGFNTGPGTPTQLNNATAIGSNALNTASNQVMLGNSSVTDTRTFGAFTPMVTTVAGLPAAGSVGRIAVVTDATAPTYLGALTGGGTVKTPVMDNGTAWVSF